MLSMNLDEVKIHLCGFVVDFWQSFDEFWHCGFIFDIVVSFLTCVSDVYCVLFVIYFFVEHDKIYDFISDFIYDFINCQSCSRLHLKVFYWRFVTTSLLLRYTSLYFVRLRYTSLYFVILRCRLCIYFVYLLCVSTLCIYFVYLLCVPSFIFVIHFCRSWIIYDFVRLR